MQYVVIIIGVLLAWWAATRLLGARWASIGWGALAFPLSQLLRFALVIPLQIAFTNWFDRPTALLAIAVLMVVTSGLFEETTRWIVLRFWAKKVRPWREGVGFGLGHGGIEAILLFTSTLSTNMMLLRNGDMVKAQVAQSGDPAAVEALETQIDMLNNLTFGLISLGWYERVLAICAHVAFTLIVLRAVRERRWQLWLLAVVAHIVFNAVAVITMDNGVVWTYGFLTAFTAVALWAVVAGPLSRRVVDAHGSAELRAEEARAAAGVRF